MFGHNYMPRGLYFLIETVLATYLRFGAWAGYLDTEVQQSKSADNYWRKWDFVARDNYIQGLYTLLLKVSLTIILCVQHW